MFRKIVKDGQDYPKWYGAAFYEFIDLPGEKWAKVCYPIPLNIILSLYQRIRHVIKFKMKDCTAMRIYHAGFDDGYRKAAEHEQELGFVPFMSTPVSSKGRTPDFEPENEGSIPSTGTKTTKRIKGKKVRL